MHDTATVGGVTRPAEAQPQDSTGNVDEHGEIVGLVRRFANVDVAEGFDLAAHLAGVAAEVARARRKGLA